MNRDFKLNFLNNIFAQGFVELDVVVVFVAAIQDEKSIDFVRWYSLSLLVCVRT